MELPPPTPVDDDRLKDEDEEEEEEEKATVLIGCVESNSNTANNTRQNSGEDEVVGDMTRH